MKQIGLVLQGGGALGAYESGVLRRLYQLPGFKPDVVSGVSIGAVNAAAIVGSKMSDPVKTLTEMWRRFEVSPPILVPDAVERLVALYGNPSFFRVRLDYLQLLSWTNFYDTSPLRETLEQFVSFEKINESKQHLVLTATNIETGEIETFHNGKGGGITADHVLASGSLPPGFPMTRIGDAVYWDGGLFDNTPLGPAIELLNPDHDVEKLLVVINLFPSKGKIPGNMMEVYDRMFEILFSNRIHSDVQMMKKINECVEAVKAIDKDLDPKSRIRRMPGYKRLLKYKIISEVLYITNDNPEVASGPFDFSRGSIARRAEEGFRDADRKLREMKLA